MRTNNIKNEQPLLSIARRRMALGLPRMSMTFRNVSVLNFKRKQKRFAGKSILHAQALAVECLKWQELAKNEKNP